MSISIAPEEGADYAAIAASPARCLHLAAHAVIEHELGVGPFFTVAKIRAYSCYASDGWKKFPVGMPSSEFAARMEDATIDLFAGIAAEMQAFGPAARISASVDDLSMAHACVAAICRRPNDRVDERGVAERLGKLEWMARALVTQHWLAITAVADQRRDRGSITAANVAATVDITGTRTDA